MASAIVAGIGYVIGGIEAAGVAGVAAAVGAGAAVYSATKSPPKVPQIQEAKKDKLVAEADIIQRDKLKRGAAASSGRSSTILTGGGGLGQYGTSNSSPGGKTLLGM